VILNAIQSEFDLIPKTVHPDGKKDVKDGALTLRGEGFLTARRLRGLHAALCALPNLHELRCDDRWCSPEELASQVPIDDARARARLRDRVESTTRRAAEYLVSLQVTHGDNPHRGGFTRAISRMKVQITAQAKDFNMRLNEVRMDTVADVLHALMGARKTILGQPCV